VEGRNIIGPALLSSLLWLAAFPPLNLWGLSFIASIPLFIAIKAQPNTKKAFQLGVSFGFVFMLGFHSWMLELRAWGPLPGVIIMWVLYSAYLSLFYGALTMTLYKLKHAMWSYPIVWVVFEYLKSISTIGNPAGTVGYTLGYTPVLNQLASFGGVFFLSFLIISVTTLLLYGIQRRPKYSIKHLVSAGVILIVWCTCGALLMNHEIKPSNYANITLIQPNHPQEKKLNKFSWAKLRRDHIKLIQNALKTENPHMLFLPETITPGLNTKRDHFMTPLKQLSAQHNVGIFFGTPLKRDPKYFNSIAVMTPKGLGQESYDKVQLMPFGEYWPAKSFFLKLGLKNIIPGSEFTPGQGFWPITFNEAEVGALVCLESIYPWFSRKLVKNQASLLYVAANNAWFFNSSAAQKHLQMSTLRAVETHRSLIHATNTGISGFISPKGIIRHKTALDTQATLSQTTPLYTNTTLYTRIGELWLLALLLLGSVFFILKRRLRKN
jgi:apolipoprotein N-acyltransferase